MRDHKAFRGFAVRARSCYLTTPWHLLGHFIGCHIAPVNARSRVTVLPTAVMASPGELVLSDVHKDIAQPTISKSETTAEVSTLCYPVSSRFIFNPPLDEEEKIDEDREDTMDEDGDIIPGKRLKRQIGERAEVIKIDHMMSTQVNKVGLQVWMASFLLSDFILANSKLFEDTFVLELGGGTGLCSILLASTKVSKVICTDTGDDILKLCKKNILKNSHLCNMDNGPASKSVSKVIVRDLDWMKTDLVEGSDQLFHWRQEDKLMLSKVKYIIAADVIYEDSLTDAFFKTLQKLMVDGSAETAFIALEKRINFSLDELAVICPAHDHFMEWVKTLNSSKTFHCSQVETSFPKCFSYTRTKELELWKLTCTGKNLEDKFQ